MPTVTSCGVLLLNAQGELFVCHATGSARWDLPKGVGEDAEGPRATAVREAWEETGLRIPPVALHEQGSFSYLSGKRLHLFALKTVRTAFNVAHCRCRSYFPHFRTGVSTPEVDAFAWKPIAEAPTWAGKGLQKVLGAQDWASLQKLPVVATLDVDTTA